MLIARLQVQLQVICTRTFCGENNVTVHVYRVINISSCIVAYNDVVVVVTSTQYSQKMKTKISIFYWAAKCDENASLPLI